ncbi:aromatic acid/H+ symport family MFS transporter [Bacillus smithii]|uniref:MFS transporter n=1 Tax=Bacillus smithii TaxID=1479 RepID=UPI002E1D7B8A|nr:aromatic acid/H+ symport family MFS transporter [Bacillus smithii]MED1456993.1 aromatic acid/H+ symport family MFS transporter [Bacillus smithii]
MKAISLETTIGEIRFNRFHFKLIVFCFFLIMCDGYDLFMFGTVVPSLIKEWNMNAVQVGALNSYALIGMMIGALIFGPAADKFGRKSVIAFCTFLFCLFTGWQGFAHSPSLFATLRFISGIGLGGLMPNSIALVTEYAPRKWRSTLVAIMFSGHPFGGVVAALAGMHFVENFGWRPMFWIGAIPIVVIPFFLLFVPESPHFYLVRNKKDKIAFLLSRVTGKNHFSETDEYEINVENRKGFPVTKLFAENRAFSTIMFWISFFLLLITMYGLNTWLPNIMITAGYAVHSSFIFLLLLNLGACVGGITEGLLADHFGSKRVLVVLFLLGSLSLILLGLKPERFFLYLLLFIAGAATTGAQIVSNAFVSQYYPSEMRSTGIGWALGIGRMGGILGPTLGGVLMTQALSLPLNFLAFAIPGIIASVAISFVQLRHSDEMRIAAKDASSI